MGIPYNPNAAPLHPDEAINLREWFLGLADGIDLAGKTEHAAKFRRAAVYLNDIGAKLCGKGYVGCRGGIDCSSDHK